MNLRKFTKLRERLETLRRDEQRAAGARDQLLLRLKTEFGCDSVQAAKKLLAKLEADSDRENGEFQTALKEFEVKYGEVDTRAIY